MEKLVATIQHLEQDATTKPLVECTRFCFLNNCSKCTTGCLYQASVLRNHAQKLAPNHPLPPVPIALYKNTIKILEK
jgi:hypothetical protein